MKRRTWMGLWMGLVLCHAEAALGADPGKEVVGFVTVRVFFGTDGDPSSVGHNAWDLKTEVKEKLRSQDPLSFKHYRGLGHDRQEVFRSYENWAKPIEGSDEILCRFEVQKRVEGESMRLDLELWLSRKKVLKSGVLLSVGKPMLVLGPEWRGGRLIISVEIDPIPSS
ncbi:MAG: hypothetical protein ACQKBU_00710 [Verrucomicrobiales bacterium]